MRVGIVGGSIGGLAAATVFHRLGATVRVFEKSASPFEGRGGSLGFCDIALWQRLAARQMLRRGQQASRAQGAFLYGDLWQFWAAGLPPGTVTYGAHIQDLGPDPLHHPTINGEAFDLAIIADGGWSELRTRYFAQCGAPEYAGYTVWRFRVEAAAVPGFADYGEYRNGHHATILLPVAMNSGQDWVMGGSAVAQSESEVVTPSPAGNRQAGEEAVAVSAAGGQAAPAAVGPSLPDWFLPFYKEKFGGVQGGQLYRVMQAAAQAGKITPLPQYEYAAPQVVQGRLLLVGDAAHMASPRTAVGAHTAVLDAAALLEAFSRAMGRGGSGSEGQDWGAVVEQGLALYGPPAVQRAQQLYARSREVSREVCPAGWRTKSEEERARAQVQ